MNPHLIGRYLIGLCIFLLLASIWQVTLGSGHADFSFLILLPFAWGTLKDRDWGFLGTIVFGLLSSLVAIASLYVNGNSFTVGFGPIHLINPSEQKHWFFVISYLLLVGVPTISLISRIGTRKSSVNS